MSASPGGQLPPSDIPDFTPGYAPAARPVPQPAYSSACDPCPYPLIAPPVEPPVPVSEVKEFGAQGAAAQMQPVQPVRLQYAEVPQPVDFGAPQAAPQAGAAGAQPGVAPGEYYAMLRPDGTYILIPARPLAQGPAQGPAQDDGGVTWLWIVFVVGCFVPLVMWVLCCALSGAGQKKQYGLLRHATRVMSAIYASFITVAVLIVLLASMIVIAS